MAHATNMSEDDAEALRVRRAELHEFMREIAAAALMLPNPETYLEAERAVRAITMADRMGQKLRDVTLSEAEEAGEEKQDTPPPPKKAVPLPINGAEKETHDPVRTALRILADRIMAAARTLPMPDNALTALRALRYARACERMLTQLYTPPQFSPPKPKPAPPVDPYLRLEQIKRELWEQHSPSPQAQAIRAAKRAAQSAAERQTPEPLKTDIPELPTHADGSAEDTKTPTDGPFSLNPRPNISEGQAAKRKQKPRPPLRGPPSP
jgi:hypothetical protein